MSTKTKTNTKTKPKPKAKKAESGAADKKPSGAKIDCTWLPESAQKQVDHFLEQVGAKKQCDKDKVVAACVAYCAHLSTAQYGVNAFVQGIEATIRCKL